MLFITFIVLGALIVLVLIIGFLSPRIAKMERSITIKSNPEKAFVQLNSLKNFVNNWSPWTEKDLKAKHEYNDINEGVGATYAWEGDPKTVSKGNMEIVESDSLKVKSSLAFHKRGTAYVSTYIERLSDEEIKVTWDFEADNGMNPISRIFGNFMNKFLGPDYETGLSKLKKYLEEN